MKPLITSQELTALMPKLPSALAQIYAPLLSAAMQENDIISKARRCAFIANLAHESVQLTKWTENLNYTANRLLVVFPNYFKSQAMAKAYALKPQMIAARVYANRMGNGSEESGDGWTYRGRCPIGLTGKINYLKYGNLLDLNLVGNPDLALLPENGFRIAALFWKANSLNELADRLTLNGDKDDRAVLTLITKRINGGTNGLTSRVNYFRVAKQVLHGDADAQTLGLPPTEAPVKPEPEEQKKDLFDSVVASEKVKTLWPRIAKHVTAGLVWLSALYEAHNYIGGLIFVVIGLGIAWVVYHNKDSVKSAIYGWLK